MKDGRDGQALNQLFIKLPSGTSTANHFNRMAASDIGKGMGTPGLITRNRHAIYA